MGQTLLIRVAQLLRLLQEEIQSAADRSVKEWWERYLKGEAKFRGTPMAQVRKFLHEWYRDNGIADLTLEQQKLLAWAMFESDYSEDKIAGILMLREILIPLDALDLSDIGHIESLYSEGYIADWNVSDWLCVKVLGELIRLRGSAFAKHVSTWKETDGIWLRRSAGVAFVNLAPLDPELFPGIRKLILEICTSTVAHSTRFSQTGTGWVLRELSKVAADDVAQFIRHNRPLFSREALLMATAKLESEMKRDLRSTGAATAVR